VVAASLKNAGGDNLGFGISATMVDRVVPALIEDGDYEHSYVGIRTQPVNRRIALANDLEEARGVMVVEVVSGGPADGVLQGATGQESTGGTTVRVGGDVIVAIDGTAVPTRDALSSYLARETSPGDTITITVIRDGEEQQVELTLAERPAPE